ncbi:hypothetical protein KCV07_g583, partial [Aureobasidium melanogenum]
MKAQFILTPRFTVVRRLPIVVVARPNTVPNPARRPAFYPQELRKHKHYLPSNAIIIALTRASNNLKRSLQKPPVVRTTVAAMKQINVSRLAFNAVILL